MNELSGERVKQWWYNVGTKTAAGTAALLLATGCSPSSPETSYNDTPTPVETVTPPPVEITVTPPPSPLEETPTPEPETHLETTPPPEVETAEPEIGEEDPEDLRGPGTILDLEIESRAISDNSIRQAHNAQVWAEVSYVDHNGDTVEGFERDSDCSATFTVIHDGNITDDEGSCAKAFSINTRQFAIGDEITIEMHAGTPEGASGSTQENLTVVER